MQTLNIAIHSLAAAASTHPRTHPPDELSGLGQEPLGEDVSSHYEFDHSPEQECDIGSQLS